MKALRLALVSALFTAWGGARAVLVGRPGVTARIVGIEPGDPDGIVHVEFAVDARAGNVIAVGSISAICRRVRNWPHGW